MGNRLYLPRGKHWLKADMRDRLGQMRAQHLAEDETWRIRDNPVRRGVVVATCAIRSSNCAI